MARPLVNVTVLVGSMATLAASWVGVVAADARGVAEPVDLPFATGSPAVPAAVATVAAAATLHLRPEQLPPLGPLALSPLPALAVGAGTEGAGAGPAIRTPVLAPSVNVTAPALTPAPAPQPAALVAAPAPQPAPAPVRKSRAS